MSGIGSLAWAQATKGRLRLGDRLQLTAQVLSLRVARLLRSSARDERASARVDINAIRWPDSPAARRAFDECAAASPAYMTNHCARTYLWGCLLAMHRGVRYDEEVLFVAAMLHDLGLTDRAAAPREHASCFAARGAFAARDLLVGTGWPRERSDIVAEAISLHLNVAVDERYSPEARLLHAGAGCDVIGAGLRAIPKDAREQVLTRFPRLDFKREWVARMDIEERAQPGTRLAFLYGLGFRSMIGGSPFPE